MVPGCEYDPDGRASACPSGFCGAWVKTNHRVRFNGCERLLIPMRPSNGCGPGDQAVPGTWPALQQYGFFQSEDRRLKATDIYLTKDIQQTKQGLREPRPCISIMRILFVITNIGVVECYGPMILASIARKRGHQADYVRFSARLVQKRIEKWQPDVVAWSASSGDFCVMAPLNDQLKKQFSFISVFGGPHPTFFPESLFEHSIDYGVIGEGEGAFHDLLEAWEKGVENCRIDNVITPAHRECSVRPLVANLDDLPSPDYDGFYRADKWLSRFPVKMFMPSRGCPFNCSYCFNHQYRAMYRGKGIIVRRHSVSRIIDEIRYVQTHYPLELVRFNDDCFVMKQDAWIEEFCEKYPREIGLPFLCEINPHLVTEGIAEILSQAGCRTVFMSIECGDETVRKRLLARHVTNENILNAFELLRRHQISVLSSNVLALPEAAFEVDLQTLRLNQACRPACCIAGIFSPYPKLALTNHAIQTGFLRSDESVSFAPTFFGKSRLSFPEKTKAKQKNLSSVFCMLVSFPWLARGLLPVIHCSVLIRPFSLLNSLWMAYLFQTRIYPHRITPRRVLDNVVAAIDYFGRMLRD